jgi:uncharacterized protein YbbC (DUF1343 family)
MERISVGEPFESMSHARDEISEVAAAAGAGGIGSDKRILMGRVKRNASGLALPVVAAFLIAGVGSYLDAGPAVVPGIDVLRETGGEVFRGKRLGLVTNHTGKTIDGTSTGDVLRNELGLDLVALYSPEHGFTGDVAAGDPVDSGSERTTGLPVYSLYGKTLKPTPAMLHGIDTLIFDIQDVGVRFYTYISTLKLSMEACAEAGIEMAVLDRPNPSSGTRIEGPVLEKPFQSFIGIAPIALLHGMTVGELAGMFNGEGMLEGGKGVRLEVIRARGWRRDMEWEDTGLPWRQTSPNIRTAEAAVAYPAMGLFEGVNVSEGRGTEDAFLLIGAPWIEEAGLVPRLAAMNLPGTRFLPKVFTPRSVPAAPHPIYQDVVCRGVRFEVTDRRSYQAVRTGLSALAAILRMYPGRARWEVSGESFVIDRLLGTDVPRKRLDAGDGVDEILTGFEPEMDAFMERRARYLLYP